MPQSISQYGTILRRKVNGAYVPANTKKITRNDCPVKVTTDDNNGFMRVLEGAWAVSVMFAMMIVENTVLKVIALTPTATASTHIFALPAEANVSVSNHTLVRS